METYWNHGTDPALFYLCTFFIGTEHCWIRTSYITNVAKPRGSRQQNAAGRLRRVTASHENAHFLLLSACAYFCSSPFQKAWRSIMRLNILLLLGSLKCIIKVWKRPCTASMALWSHSHSWTTTTPYSLPMVMVGMIKSLMSSVFTIQFKREGSQIDRRLYSHQNRTADKQILLKSLVKVKP